MSEKSESKNYGLKIGLLDIETSPNLGWIWGKWQQDVIEFVAEWDLLCWTVKELGGKSVTRGLCDVKNERQLVKELWDQFNRYDVLIAHNGDEFDIKKSNAKFTLYNLPPPMPYRTVDTVKVARKYFSFNSNKLNDLAQYLGIGAKVETGGFKLWKGCMAGDKNSWRLMKKYNAQDVLLLEKVYRHLLPWIKNHPNINLLVKVEDALCPKCGSRNIEWRGYASTQSLKYKRFQCQDCGGWGRAKNSEEPIETNILPI